MSFIARYRGTCEDCGESIEVGQEAAYVGDGIIHVPKCPAEPDPLKHGVCPQCFCALPATGKCDCRE